MSEAMIDLRELLAWAEKLYTSSKLLANGGIECGEWINATRAALVAQPATPAPAVPEGFCELLAKSFTTCESDGARKRYSVVMKLPTLAEAQALHNYICHFAEAPASGGES